MTGHSIIIVTGSRKGIGRTIAEYYLEKGNIVLGCSRAETDLNHENYRHYCLDVSDEIAVKLMFKSILKEFGHLDVLINNAGIASMNHSLLTPISTVRKILDTNVVGNYLFSREAAKLMKQNKYGRIINFATFAVPFKLEGEAIYAASKAAVITLTEILSREYAPFNITVNAVAPPAIQTDLVKGVSQDKMNKLLERQSIHRYGTATEVCQVIDFLINPLNEMITGQTIYMGGL
jgi:3-oxoacyl-[acyl-carrier protein] reductase